MITVVTTVERDKWRNVPLAYAAGIVQGMEDTLRQLDLLASAMVRVDTDSQKYGFYWVSPAKDNYSEAAAAARAVNPKAIIADKVTHTNLRSAGGNVIETEPGDYRALFSNVVGHDFYQELFGPPSPQPAQLPASEAMRNLFPRIIAAKIVDALLASG